MPRNLPRSYPIVKASPSIDFEVNRRSRQAHGLLAWWTARRSAGTGVVTDVAGGNDARLDSNAPTWNTDAEFGTRLTFASASTQGANADHDADLDSADTTFSVAFWFRIDDASNQGYIVTKGLGGSGGWGIRVLTSGILRIETHNSSGGNSLRVTGTTAVDDGNWHHCVAVITTDTVTTANNTGTIYLDGADDTASVSQFSTYSASNSAIRFGRTDSGGFYWDGDLFEVRYYDRPISELEAWRMYAPESRFELYAPIDRRGKVGLATAAPNITLDTLTLAGSAVSHQLSRTVLLDTLTLASSAVRMAADLTTVLDTLTLAGSAVKVNTGLSVTVSLNTLTLASSTPALAVQKAVIQLQTLTLNAIAVSPLLVEAIEPETAEKSVFLRLVEENTAQVFNLADCGVYTLGVNYRPRMPEISTDSNVRTNRDGANLTNIRYDNVTESLDWVLSHTKGDGILYIADQLNRFFHKARERQRRGRGNRIFIEYRPAGRDDFEDKVRSEILAGSFQFPDEALSPQLRGKLMTVQVAWTRRHYWESLTEQEIVLQNSRGQGIGGVEVINHHDDDGKGTDDNYLYVSQMIGTLPVRARMLLQNVTPTGDPTNKVYISHNIYSTPDQLESTALKHIIEMEAGVAGDDVVAYNEVTGDPNHSNNGYSTMTWSGTGEAEVWDYEIDSELDKTNNNYFRILGRLANNFGSGTWQAKFRIKLKRDHPLNYDDTLVETDWVELVAGQRLQEFGTVQLPPGNLPDNNIRELILTLVMKRTGGTGLNTIDMDYLQLSPIDSWRVLSSPQGLEHDHFLFDDGMEERVYQINTGTGQGGLHGGWSSHGEWLEFDPNVEQRLYILQQTRDGLADIYRRLKVRIFYRPRSLAPYLFDINNFP